MFETFLKWLTSVDGGALIIIMWTVAWGLEKFNWWQQLDKTLKQLIVLVAAIFVGLLATVAQQNPGFVNAVEPYFEPVMYIVMAWLTGQGFHEINPFRTRVQLSNPSDNSKMSS